MTRYHLARLRGRLHRWAAALSARLRTKRKADPEPSDPYALVPVPVGGGPDLRSGAVALAEPGEPLITDAYARRVL